MVPGSEAGYAITDVLFGDVNPSAKLSATFPRSVGQVPIFYNHKNTGRPLANKGNSRNSVLITLTKETSHCSHSDLA